MGPVGDPVGVPLDEPRRRRGPGRPGGDVHGLVSEQHVSPEHTQPSGRLRVDHDVDRSRVGVGGHRPGRGGHPRVAAVRHPQRPLEHRPALRDLDDERSVGVTIGDTDPFPYGALGRRRLVEPRAVVVSGEQRRGVVALQEHGLLPPDRRRRAGSGSVGVTGQAEGARTFTVGRRLLDEGQPEVLLGRPRLPGQRPGDGRPTAPRRRAEQGLPGGGQARLSRTSGPGEHRPVDPREIGGPDCGTPGEDLIPRGHQGLDAVTPSARGDDVVEQPLRVLPAGRGRCGGGCRWRILATQGSRRTAGQEARYQEQTGQPGAEGGPGRGPSVGSGAQPGRRAPANGIESSEAYSTDLPGRGAWTI